MMADGLLPTELLQEAIEGFQEFSARLDALIQEEVDPLDSVMRFIRQIPATDTMKKEELSKFFASSAGGHYTRAERKAAYDDLLGRERNLENMG